MTNIVQDDEGGLWPAREVSSRTMHGIAWPDPDGNLVVRYVDSGYQLHRWFQEIQDQPKHAGAIRVTARQTTTVERSDWTPFQP